jgi:23S rRNA pseudouridine1911/1915/1917 synthase
MPSHKPTIPYPYTTVVTVENYLDREKIDRFLTRHFRNYTRQRMQRLIRGGYVWIDDALAEPRFRVRAGQLVRVRLIEPPDKLLEAQDLPLEILYEDEHVIAVNKPPRQSAHPGGNYHDGTLANAVQFYLDRQTPLPGLLRPGIVHRLDRLTSGVIVVCKDHHAHRNLSIAFQTGRVAKTYLALVHGHVGDDAGEIDAAIGRAPNSMLMCIDPAATERKAATTRFRVLERFELPYALVEAKPLTGRLHQIRVHLSSIRHAIVGDEFYGVSNDEQLMDRQALHAAEIAFSHPLTGEPLVIAAPLPADFQQAVDRLRRKCG